MMHASAHFTPPRQEALDAVRSATRSIAAHLAVDAAIHTPEASTALAQRHDLMLLALEQALRFAQWLEVQSLNLRGQERWRQGTAAFSPFFEQLFGRIRQTPNTEGPSPRATERALAAVDAQIQAIDRVATLLANELIDHDARLLAFVAHHDHAAVAGLLDDLVERAEEHALALSELAGGMGS